MNNKTTIYVVRHGQSIGNAKHDYKTDHNTEQYGELQSPLTELGIEQAREIAEKLKDIKIDAILSSDLTRARQTAEIIAHGRTISVETVSTIRERNFAKEYKLLTDEKREELKKALANLTEEEKFLHKFFPDGESAQDAYERFLRFLKEIISVYRGKTILVVNHGAIMRSFLIKNGYGTFDELPSGSISNAAYFVTETDGHTFTIKETSKITKH